MSRLGSSILIGADALDSDDDAIAAVVTSLQDFYDEMVEIVNGGLELVENYGVAITGTTDAGANNLNTVGHDLGRVPTFIHLIAETAGVPAAHNFYWQAADRLAWTESVVTFRCTAASIPYRGYVA